MKKVLFVCAENAGRSQMSEAYFNNLKKDGWLAESAGTIPAQEINPKVIQVLAEDGIVIKQKSPQLFDPACVEGYEKIISYGCVVKEFFSTQVQAKIENWDIKDPRDQSIEEIMKIRDIIKQKVFELIREL